jgi:hypothetical protein
MTPEEREEIERLIDRKFFKKEMQEIEESSERMTKYMLIFITFLAGLTMGFVIAFALMKGG